METFSTYVLHNEEIPHVECRLWNAGWFRNKSCLAKYWLDIAMIGSFGIK